MTDLKIPLNNRVAWIDTAKGIGIILVVVGHVDFSAFKGRLSWFIFLFHMPLFFILSGILSKNEPLGKFFWKKVRSLLIPYTSFLFIFGGFLIAEDIMRHGNVSRDITNLVYGGSRLDGNLIVFWFITCLFIAQLAFVALLSLSPEPLSLGLVVPVVACLAVSVALSGHSGPLAVAVSPFAVVMLWVGYLYRAKFSFSTITPLVSALAAGVLLSTSLSFVMNLKYAVYGPPITGALLAIVLSFIVIEIGKQADKLPIIGETLQWLGRGSLAIMFLHQFIHFSLQTFTSSELILTLISIAIPMVVYEVARRSKFLSLVILGEYSGKRPVVLTLPS